MKRRIRLSENNLRRVIRESVKRLIREYKEYDWDEFEEDPEWNKVIDNDMSWDTKNGRDKLAMSNSYPENMRYSEDDDAFELSDHEWCGAMDKNEPYDSGYDNIFGNRDVTDEYFSDSDYRFSHNEWDDNDKLGPINTVDRTYEPDSDLNRAIRKRQNNESRLRGSDLRRVISENVKRVLREFDEPYDWEGLDDDRKDFENFLSWRNKEEVDANDRVMSGDLDGTFIPPEDYERANEFFRDQEMAKERPDAKRHWDWGYKSALPDDLATLTLPDGIGEYEAQAIDLNRLFDESKIRRTVRESLRRASRRRR